MIYNNELTICFNIVGHNLLSSHTPKILSVPAHLITTSVNEYLLSCEPLKGYIQTLDNNSEAVLYYTIIQRDETGKIPLSEFNISQTNEKDTIENYAREALSKLLIKENLEIPNIKSYDNFRDYCINSLSIYSYMTISQIKEKISLLISSYYDAETVQKVLKMI